MEMSSDLSRTWSSCLSSEKMHLCLLWVPKGRGIPKNYVQIFKCNVT